MTLSSLLARAAKVSMQTAAALLVPDDEVVDRLVADEQDPFQLESLRDLLRAPVLLHPPGHQVQLLGTELPASPLTSAPGGRIAVGHFRAVLAIVSASIAAQFSANRTARTPQHSGNFRLRSAAYQ